MARVIHALMVAVLATALLTPPAAARTGVIEKAVTLDVTFKAAALLRRAGITVRMTRGSDVYLSLARRASIANGIAPDLVASVHANSFTDPAKRGTTVIYQLGRVEGHHAARSVLSSIARRAGTKPRGAIAVRGARGDYHAMLRDVRPAALIIETATLSNREESRLIATSWFRGKLAQGVADGIRNALVARGRPHGVVVLDAGHGGKDPGALGRA